MTGNEAFNQINAGTNLTLDVPYDLTIRDKSYQGLIHFRFPSVKDEIRMGLEEAKLRGSFIDIGGKPELISVPKDNLDRLTAFLIEGLATLKVLALEQEKFEEFPQEVIIEIYKGYLRPDDEKREPIVEHDSSDSSGESSEPTE